MKLNANLNLYRTELTAVLNNTVDIRKYGKLFLPFINI